LVENVEYGEECCFICRANYFTGEPCPERGRGFLDYDGWG
jgi:hypothetical protein